MRQQHLVEQSLLFIEVSRSHSDTPHSPGLLWTNGQPETKTSAWQHTILREDRHPWSPAGFETAIPSGGRPQTHALGRAATGIGCRKFYLTKAVMPERGKLCVPSPLFPSWYLNNSTSSVNPPAPSRRHWPPFPLDTSNAASYPTVIHSNYTLFHASHCTASWHELTQLKLCLHGGTLLESAASCLLCSQQ